MGFDSRLSNGRKIDKSNAKEPNRVERCPKEHPAWFLYHKRVKGTTETVICCKACDHE